MKRTVTSLLAIALLLLSRQAIFAAQSDEVIAVITELKFNRGDIQITAPGKTSAEKPGVLQSLYNGSKVLVSKDATAMVLFTDGSNTVKVDDKNSPYEVKRAAKSGQAAGKLKETANLLVGKSSAPNFVALAVRGKLRGPTLLSPRDGKLLTATPTFQWMGMESEPSTVKVHGPQGVIWSAENLATTQIAYPSSAPALKPGESYSWSVERRGAAVEKTSFRLGSFDDNRTLQEQLAAIDANTALPKTTAAILKGNLLVARAYFYDAREILLSAAKADPDEPTLHFLLGEVYDKTGLRNLAQEEFSEAQLLSTKKP